MKQQMKWVEGQPIKELAHSETKLARVRRQVELNADVEREKEVIR